MRSPRCISDRDNSPNGYQADSYNHPMTLLADLVATSRRVGATAARLVKVRELATFLRTLQPDEIDTAVHYLSGDMTQGRVGLGYATLQPAAAQSAATHATLSIGE